MRSNNLVLSLSIFAIMLCTEAATAQSNGTLSLADFGMQCGISNSANCSISNGEVPLPTQPGLLRLWDSSVQWSDIEQTQGTYTWGNLNAYLYGIESDPTSPAVIYTFGERALLGCVGHLHRERYASEGHRDRNVRCG